MRRPALSARQRTIPGQPAEFSAARAADAARNSSATTAIMPVLYPAPVEFIWIADLDQV